MNAAQLDRLYQAPVSGPSGCAGHDDGLWVYEDYAVILLDGDCPDGKTLSSVLQALGAQVFRGPHTVETDKEPLILVHARNRHRPEIAVRLDAARKVFPDAPISFVTGDQISTPSAVIYNDARDILCAAGIGFVCVSLPR